MKGGLGQRGVVGFVGEGDGGGEGWRGGWFVRSSVRGALLSFAPF